MNNLVRWTRPEMASWRFGGLTNLRDEIDRLFEAPLAELAHASSHLLSGWNPAIDLHEDRENVYVNVELPGMKKEEIDLSLHEGALSISGERRMENKSEESEIYRSERYVGRFHRSIMLPSPVAADKVRAQYKDGILTVTLPKTEEAKPKQINVNVA